MPITLSPQGSVDAELIQLQTEVTSLVAGGDLADLASTDVDKGAILIGVHDTANHITGTTVEAALAELALEKYELGLTTNGKGASHIGIEDSANKITAINVETALAELAIKKYDDTQVANCADDAVLGSIPIVFIVAIADGASADKDVVVTDKCEVIDVVVMKTGGAGGAADTITVKNGATAITNAMDINVSDKVVVRAGTLDDAATVITAGGTLRVSMHKDIAGGDNTACKVMVHAVRRA